METVFVGMGVLDDGILLITVAPSFGVFIPGLDHGRGHILGWGEFLN